ncbi:MAG: hypothetical protein M5R42_09625 [Rhodocyclaceae bacterium]|nr:hypothetical protein [Rhodocyclaceae bacterium]
MADAEAICGDGQRPHPRSRWRVPRNRTCKRCTGAPAADGQPYGAGQSDAGLLLEYGIALPKGMARLREGLRLVLERPSASLSATFLALLQEQYSELLDWDRKIAHYTARIERAVEADPGARQLRAVPGIGALTASALLGWWPLALMATAGTCRRPGVGAPPRGHRWQVTAVGYQQAGRPLSALPAHPWCARRGQPDERQAGPPAMLAAPTGRAARP